MDTIYRWAMRSLIVSVIITALALLPEVGVSSVSDPSSAFFAGMAFMMRFAQNVAASIFQAAGPLVVAVGVFAAVIVWMCRWTGGATDRL